MCLGTREAAFVYAISAASVAFAVTRACSSGELEKCGCDHNVHGVSPEGRSLSLFLSLRISHKYTHAKETAVIGFILNAIVLNYKTMSHFIVKGQLSLVAY